MMPNRMRFGPTMNLLFENIISGTRNTDGLTEASIKSIRRIYVYCYTKKYSRYEALDDTLSSKYVIHTLNWIED